MQDRLKQLGAPVYGDKTLLWKRLQEYEHRANAEFAYQHELARAAEERREAQGEHPARMLMVPTPPTEIEKEMHNLTHIPAKPWCPLCIRGKAMMAPHRAVLPEEKDKEIPVIAIDFTYLKADGTDTDDGGVAWATTLVAIDGLGLSVGHRGRQQRKHQWTLHGAGCHHDDEAALPQEGWSTT